jgi:hypothetical protein
MQPIHAKFHVIGSEIIYIYHDSLRYENHFGNATKSYKFYAMRSVIYICHNILRYKNQMKMQPNHRKFVRFVLNF